MGAKQKMNGNKFYHLRFVRDLDSNNSQNFQKQGKLSEYLLLDYFDFLILEQAENFEECALGKEKFSCEAEQGLGIFSLGDTADRLPFLESSSDRPFLEIIQLTINPFFYKACSSPDDISKLKSDIEQEIKNASAEDSDVKYQIYQTVNAADFCIIVISKKIKFLEHLSKLLKKKSFVYRGKKYLTFSIYENTGIHKDVTESQLQEAFGQKHALIARIRVKDLYWNGLKKGNWSSDNENCKPSMLSGRYHFSIRIEGAEIASTLKNIIDLKFNAVTPPTDNIHNVLQQIMSENKIAYINERILFQDEMECRNESEINTEPATIENPEYKGDIRRFGEIRERLKNKTDPQTLEAYLEKIQSLYYMQIKLVRYADTHISVLMFHEYYEAFLEGFLLEIENIQDDMMDDLLYHLKIGLRYLYQFADIIYSINATTFQAPKYDIVPNMSASPKLAIAYTEYLRDIINDYRCMRNAQDNDDEKQFFPNYIPIIIPEITEEYADFSMLITFPQGFIDDWAMESENWAKYIKDGKNTPLYVICQKFRMFTNISDVLTLSFHELGHYANRLSRKQRNQDLMKMLSRAVSDHIIENLINSGGTIYCFKFDSPAFYIKELFLLKQLLEKNIFRVLEQELQQVITAPELVFTKNLLEQIKMLLDPMPMYLSQEELENNTINMLLEKIRYNFGADAVKDVEIDKDKTFSEKSKCFIAIAMSKSFEIFCEYEKKINDISFSSGNERIKEVTKSIIEDCKEILNLLQKGKEYKRLDELTRRTEDNSEKLLGEFKTFKMKLPDSSEDLESVQKLEMYYEKILLLFNVIWEYEKIRKMSEKYPAEKCEDSCNAWVRKKVLLQNVCRELKRCLEAQDTMPSIPPFPSTIFEIKARCVLQLTSDMNQQQLFDMLCQAFLLRTQDVDDMLKIICSAYAEAFADLFMCKELEFDIKEYLIVMAKHARGSSAADNKLRLYSINAVVVVLMMEKEKEKDFDKILNNYIKKGICQIFKEQNREFFRQINYLGHMQDMMSENSMKKRLHELIYDIENSISAYQNDTFMEPLIRRMYDKIKSYKRLSSSEKVNFIKDSLNNPTEKASYITEKEFEFLREFYYKNRVRYMEGE